MAQHRRHNLNNPVSNFPKRLLERLGALLDKEDDLTFRDWRLLAKSMGLSEADEKIVQQTKEKTRVALTLWEHREGPSLSNGSALLDILRRMKRFDAVQEVEQFLGSEEFHDQRIKLNFREIDSAARKGDIKKLELLIGDKTVRSNKS